MSIRTAGMIIKASNIILQYPIDPTTVDTQNRVDLELPDGAVVLTVQYVGTRFMLSALIDPDAPVVSRRFYVYGTGWFMRDGPVRYIASGTTPYGSTYHFFEEVIHNVVDANVGLELL